MRRFACLGLALFLATSATAQIFKGTARNDAGRVKVLIKIENGRPKLVDLDYSVVRLHPNYAWSDFGFNVSTYQGIVGSMSGAAVNPVETYTARFRFSNWQALTGDSYSSRLHITGQHSYRDNGTSVGFLPEAGGDPVYYSEPARAYAESLRARKMVRPRFAKHPTGWTWVLDPASAKIFRVDVQIHPTTPHPWAIRIVTTRSIMDSEDTFKVVQTVHAGILHVSGNAD